MVMISSSSVDSTQTDTMFCVKVIDVSINPALKPTHSSIRCEISEFSEITQTQPKLLPKNLTFRPLSEAFIRRSWYSVLPVLDTTGRRHVKKAVVCVAQLVAALITVHGLLSFLSDVYGLFDPSGKTLWLSVDHRRLRPVDDMVLLDCMVGESRFVMFS